MGENNVSTLNNATAAQFMGRVASFSTHGSRRGYSDLGEALDDSQLNPYSERLRILARRLTAIRQEIATHRVHFGKHASIFSILKRARRGSVSGAALASAMRLGELRDEQMQIEAEILAVKQSKKEWNIINACASDMTDAQLFVKASKELLSEQEYLKIWAVAESYGAEGWKK